MTENIISVEQNIKNEIDNLSSTKGRRIFEKFFLAALGSIPWVGGFISAAASIKGDEENNKKNELQSQWLTEHSKRMSMLKETLEDISSRVNNFGEEIVERVQSEEYLTLVRKSFRIWDEAETQEKRRYISNIIINAAGTRLCDDDVVRLFLDWLSLYHEAHFKVIRQIFQNPGCTRYEIWMDIHGELVREDSAEADLYKLLVRDLSTGGVIRQARDTTQEGQFYKKHPVRRRNVSSSKVMESAFEDEKPYVLTELGKQFVHYTMNEVVARIAT